MPAAMLLALLGTTLPPLDAMPATEAAANTPADGAEALQAPADADSRMTVGVMLEGKGPYRFLVDTGAQGTVVSIALASELKLPLGPQIRVVTMAGSGVAATARVGELSLGARTFQELDVTLLEDKHIGADGIVGIDSLQDERVTLDFVRNTITLTPSRKSSASGEFEIVVRARKRAGRLIMTDAEIDGVRTDVILDTGANSTVGNRALQAALGGQPTGTTKIESATGDRISADLGMVRQLRLGRLGFSDLAIAYADAPAFARLGLTKRPAIFLGIRELRAFQRIAIDFPTRKVFFDLPAKMAAK